MATATTRGYPYPEGSDSNNVPADMQALAEAVNDSPGVTAMSTATRDALAASYEWAGRLIWNTTTLTHQQYNGSSWADVATDLSSYAPLASPTFTGTVTLPTATSVGNVSATELGYLDGVTSAIQTQLDGKAATPGAWSSYTPTLTGWTIGNGYYGAWYMQIGRLVVWRMEFVVGSTTTISGSPTFTVPVTAKASTYPPVLAHLSDNDTSDVYQAHARMRSATTFSVHYLGASGKATDLGASAPFTWAAADKIFATGFYESAS